MIHVVEKFFREYNKLVYTHPYIYTHTQNVLPAIVFSNSFVFDIIIGDSKIIINVK
jgi:hypothetical protein